MKVNKFFKVLTHKINQYDKKYKTNPFTIPKEITLIWVDDIYTKDNEYQNK